MKTRIKLAALFLILLMVCFSLNQVAAKPLPAKKGLSGSHPRILMILTGIDKVPNTQRETGFWAEEFVVPCEMFKKSGYRVSTASLKGGRAPVDPGSIDPKNVGEEPAKELRLGLDKNSEFTKTIPLAKVRVNDFSAIFVVGGHGVMWDLTNSPEIAEIVQQAVAKNRIVAAVCHGPGALIGIPLPNGRMFLEGKKVTGFSAQEEELAGMANVVPYCLEEQLNKESQEGYQKATAPWASFVVSDENLITGQNPSSSAETAQALLERLAMLNTQKK
ncbi:MAG: type 1 glutamine amidotransferase domain-containing protein [Candidatus Riflebacteria bacterium]|nr:type 1 glutamine amidotransferase domain-containing protein [Candidatus Riflebacteria bacterium]